MPLHTPPFVPSEKAVKADKNEGKKDEDNDADLSSLDEVSSDIVNNGCIKFLTKRKSRLFGDRKNTRVEIDAGECIVDILFQEFKWRIETGE